MFRKFISYRQIESIPEKIKVTIKMVILKH